MSKTTETVTKVMSVALSMAMVVTSLSVAGTVSEAKAKIKSVKVTSPVTNGGKLVLKKGQKKQIKVKVTKSGKINTKVTYKSSNSKVAKVVNEKGKVYVKAVGKNGKTAKVLITSKANKKKKATLKIKIGTPVKKVAISKLKVTKSRTNNKDPNAATRTKETKKTTKFVSFKKTTLTMTEDYDDEIADISYGESADIKVKFTPTKVGYKGMKWKAKNSKIVYVTSFGYVKPVKAGKTVIYGYTKDGTNKKVKLNVKVKAKPSLPTPTPNYEPADNRKAVVAEDFESYPVGYNWEDEKKEGTAGLATRGKEYIGKNCGKMTVVQDPENPNNKCLKVDYTGDTQAYDYAPIFNFNLKDPLDDYSAVMLQSRVVAKNTGDCQHKAVAAYFTQRGDITPEFYFDTSLTKDDAKAKGIDEKLVMFSTDASHATGKDVTYNVKGGEFDGMTYNNKNFPMFYNDWAKEKINANRTVGFKETEADKFKAGWHQNKLELNKGNITGYTKLDKNGETVKVEPQDILGTRRVSMVVGSTYSGQYQNSSLVLYLDDITFLKGDTACEAVSIENAPKKIAKGMKLAISRDNIVFKPENTTQTALTWTSSDAKVVAFDEGDSEGGSATSTKANPVLLANGVGTAKITAAVQKNPQITMSFDITVFESEKEKQSVEFDLSKVKVLPVRADGDTTTKVFSSDVKYSQSGGLALTFTEMNNEHIMIDLGQSYDLTKYEGYSIVGEADYQLTLEMYSSTVDLNQDDWWSKQSQYATYPFFGGSREHRAREGKGYGAKGVEEKVWENWVSSVEAPTKEIPGGDMTDVRYIVFKANKAPEGKMLLKKLTFEATKYVNENPSETEIDNEHGGEWFDPKAK